MAAQYARAFRLLSALKRFLNARGGSTIPLFDRVAHHIKRTYFPELDNGSSEFVTINLSNIRLSIPRRFIRHYVFEEYEPVTQKAFCDFLTPGMVVADVGAHIGFYSMLAAAKVGASGKVFAIEPCAENLKYLNENAHINGFENIEIHPVAAGKSRGTRRFHITESSDSHGFYPHPLAATVQTVEMREMPIDEIIDVPVDAVKIDVEGAELEVLHGMKRILAENRSLNLWVEWNPASMRNAGFDPLALPSYLKQMDFTDIQVLDDHEKSVRPLNQVIKRIQNYELPIHWYVNLWARRS